MTQTPVCNKMILRKGDTMEFLKSNKGVIIFYALIIIASLVLITDVKKDNLREENKYVMTNLPK